MLGTMSWLCHSLLGAAILIFIFFPRSPQNIAASNTVSSDADAGAANACDESHAGVVGGQKRGQVLGIDDDLSSEIIILTKPNGVRVCVMQSLPP